MYRRDRERKSEREMKAIEKERERNRERKRDRDVRTEDHLMKIIWCHLRERKRGDVWVGAYLCSSDT